MAENPGDLQTVDRPTAKSPEAYRTIREVADELDVPQHVLRFWETKFTQIKPLKRGGGRRYYRPEDIDLLRAIRRLLYDDGYTIRGVQKLMRESGAKIVNIAGRGAPSARSGGEDVPPGEGGLGLSAEARGQLQNLMGELTTLRDMLRGRI